jgi:hypothetical protein
MSLMSLMMATGGDPCTGAPTVDSVTITKQSSPACPSNNVFRITTTLSGALPSGMELRYYFCYEGSQSCSPSFRTPAQTGLTKDVSVPYGSSGGTDVAPFYANAKVEVVPVGTTNVCQSNTASEYTDNSVHFCE